MTPQEKLKEIKDRNDPYGGFSYGGSLNYSDANWLVARVEQLEAAARESIELSKKISTPNKEVRNAVFDATGPLDGALTTGPKPGAQE